MRGHNENDDSFNRQGYIVFLQISQDYDDDEKRHFSNATVFTRNSPTVQNDFMHCMVQLATRRILSELSEASFVAIQIDESPDVSKREQISVAFRYVSNHEGS